MKKILRSAVYVDTTEKDRSTTNLGSVRTDRLINLSRTEEGILEFLTDFYATSAEAPGFQFVYDHFEQAGNPEAITMLEEISAERFYEGASFDALFETEVEDQASQRLIRTCKEAIKIATQGLNINKTMVKGTDEAVSHLFSSAQGKPADDTGKISISMKDNDQALTDLYEERKTNPNQSYGIYTGYGMFDRSTAGIRKKQFYLHAGFGGHLKSTLMFNMILNAAVAGWNPILFTSEMPAEDVQQLLICMHSSDPKFNGIGKSLPSFRLLLGALSDEEEDFYKTVKDDLLNNKSHGSIRVIDSGDFTTFGSIMQRTIRENVYEEIDLLWVDYITRLPVDIKYRGMDITSARNETIADAKRFSMSFNKGEGLPVCSPFQINREGYKKAKLSEGRMDKTALAMYNAAEKEADIISYIFYDDEEMATSEPKIGLMKSRWGAVPSDPESVYIDPDSRRIFDLTAGMGASTGHSPTAGGEEDVEL